MENQPYLIFLHNNSFYGVEAFSVKEIFLLPEVTAIAEIPDPIIGVINLRGNILPIMDLNLRLGYPYQEYSVTDTVVVVECQQCIVGIIVNQVYEVKYISTTDITTAPYGYEEIFTHESERYHQQHFVSGVATVEEKLIVLFSRENLVKNIEVSELSLNKKEKIDLFPQISASENAIQNQKFSKLIFCPNATVEERAIFQGRAKNLMLVTQSQDFSGLIPLAVIGLNEEYFGINLEVVREFKDIHKITPIPCTPKHIFGNMNLRGEIVTLVDICGKLNLPHKITKNSQSKALIFEIEDLVAGIRVDNVFDVVYLHHSEIKSVPAAINNSQNQDEYLLGTAIYQNKIMSIINLPKIIKEGGMVVEEEV